MTRTNETVESLDRMPLSRFWALAEAVASAPDPFTSMMGALMSSIAR